MTNSSNISEFPEYLAEYGQFFDHLQSTLSNLTNSDKGSRFANFGKTLIRVTEHGKHFSHFDLQQASHDGGVDIVASDFSSNEVLYVQSKYTVSSADDIDGIISKFKNFDDLRNVGESGEKPQLRLDFLLDDDVVKHESKTSIYMIFTASLINGTDKLRNFEQSHRPSRKFYDYLVSENRLIILDGKEVLRAAQAAYRKSHFLPTDVEITFQGNWISYDGVYIGILPGTELVRLYDVYGDALFLENIRSWLGPTAGLVPKSGRESVNEAIVNTIQSDPEKFLGRNNGITFRSGRVSQVSDNVLKLDEASIVNGCQTTMSIATESRGSSVVHVLVKVVETEDAWDIAGSANFQTKVDRIDIDVAKYVRTQALREVADKYGYQLLTGSNVPPSLFAVFEAISQADIQEKEIKATFIGLFSRSPNNAVLENYTELNSNMLDSYAEDQDSDWFLSTLFRINQLSKESSEAMRELDTLPDSFKTFFRRFWIEDTGKSQQYRAFLSILALCDLISSNMYESENRTYKSLHDSLLKARNLIDADPESFRRAYERAFRAVAVHLLDPKKNPDEIVQHMSRYIDTLNFDVLFMSLAAFHMRS